MVCGLVEWGRRPGNLIACMVLLSGKSTQLPSFILEHQLSQGMPCKILCTEPRRISAITLAQRVSRELGDAPGAVGTMASLVGYSIRLESNTSRNTRLTYCTNGIALRMLEDGSGRDGNGMALDDITHIIIDEVRFSLGFLKVATLSFFLILGA